MSQVSAESNIATRGRRKGRQVCVSIFSILLVAGLSRKFFKTLQTVQMDECAFVININYQIQYAKYVIKS